MTILCAFLQFWPSVDNMIPHDRPIRQENEEFATRRKNRDESGRQNRQAKSIVAMAAMSEELKHHGIEIDRQMSGGAVCFDPAMAARILPCEGPGQRA